MSVPLAPPEHRSPPYPQGDSLRESWRWTVARLKLVPVNIRAIARYHRHVRILAECDLRAATARRDAAEAELAAYKQRRAARD